MQFNRKSLVLSPYKFLLSILTCFQLLLQPPFIQTPESHKHLPSTSQCFPMTILVSFIFIISTLTACRAGRRTWLLVDTLFPLFFGVSLLITPSYLLHFLTTTSHLDFTSYYLARVVGLLLISSSVLTHRAYQTQVRCERAAICIARAITASTILLTSIHSYLHYPQWDRNFFYFVIIGATCWTLPYLYYSLTICDLGKPQSYRLYTFLVIDHLLCKAVGIAWLAFPNWLLQILRTNTSNAITTTLGRIVGSLLLGLSSVSLTATGFPGTTSKMYIHCNVLFTSATLVFVVVLGIPWDETFSLSHLLLGCLSALIWATNAMFGYIYLLYIKEGEDHARRLMKPSHRTMVRKVHPSTYQKRVSSNHYDTLDDISSPLSQSPTGKDAPGRLCC